MVALCGSCWISPLSSTSSPLTACKLLQVDLVPGGHTVGVSADNRLAYIHRVADYRLNRQIREPAAAFLRHALLPLPLPLPLPVHLPPSPLGSIVPSAHSHASIALPWLHAHLRLAALQRPARAHQPGVGAHVQRGGAAGG